MSGFHGGWTGGRALPPDVGRIGGVGTSPDGGVVKLHKTCGMFHWGWATRPQEDMVLVFPW